MSAAKGILIWPTSMNVLVDTALTDTTGVYQTVIATGTPAIKLSEIQTDGTLKAVDFSTSPPSVCATSATVPTTATLNLTNQSAGGVARYYWSASFVGTGLTIGGIYLIEFVVPSGIAQPAPRKGQYGSGDGDLAVTAAGNAGADLQTIKGTSSAGAAGYVGIDWSHVNAPTSAVNLSGTTISAAQAVASVAGNVGGNVNGSVGSISNVTFPANFPSLAIDTSGNVRLVGAPKKGVALSGFQFQMALSSDHVSAATGKTITATRSLDGGAFSACTNAATELSGGWYTINLSASDMNGGSIALSFAAASCDVTAYNIITTP